MRFILLFLLAAGQIFATGNKDNKESRIAVFIPGVINGSPIYEQLDAGVKNAAKEHGILVKTIEGGFNQAEWPEKMKAIAASGLYDLIVTSNPSMPAIADAISKDFPEQKFLCMDSHFSGNKNIYTAEFNQTEQAFLAGYMAGLITTSSLPGANKEKKVGFIAAQHYPVLDNTIIPGFQKGLEAVDPEITMDLRIIGNWWDANKAADLTSKMTEEGCDVFLSISGGATQGVISESQKKGTYMIYFDSNGYSLAPGTILGSAIIRQQELSYELVTRYLKGDLPFGEAETFGAKDGYVDFTEDDPLYQQHVPEEIKEAMKKAILQIKN